MFDELDRLRNNPDLLQLLTHYTTLAEPNRQDWQDRLMSMEGVERAELVKLHGELIAYSWIDQNTGNTPVLRAGAVPACYRATVAGIRAVQQVRCPEPAEEWERTCAPVGEEPSAVKPPRRKREKGGARELVAASSGVEIHPGT
jgi:hypothetical protein